MKDILKDYNNILKISSMIDDLEILINDFNHSDETTNQFKSLIENFRICLKLKRISLKKIKL